MNDAKMTRAGVALALLSMVMVAPAFGSGGDEGASGDAMPEITYMANFEFVPEATSETLMFKEWGERVGVVINPVFVLVEDQPVRFQTMLAAGDLPDMMFLQHPTVGVAHFEFGPQGVFASTSDLVAEGKMPHLAEALRRLEPEGLMIASDGKSYMTPLIVSRANGPFAGVTARRDYLEAGGWRGDLDNITGTVNTLDDWEDVFAATYRGINIGKSSPDPILINRRGVGERGWITTVMSLNTGTYIRMHYNDDNEYIFGPASPRYRAGIEFLAKAFAENWLHPNWVTMTEEEQVALYARDAYGVFFGPIGGNVGDRAAGRPEYVETIVEQSRFLLPPVIEGERANLRQAQRVFPTRAYMLSAGSRNLDAAARALDYMYSTEGAELLQFGPEGYSWVKDDNPWWGRRWILNWSGYYPTAEVQADPSREKTRSLGIGSGGTRPPMMPFDMWGKDNLIRYVDVTQPGIEQQFITQNAIEVYKEHGVWRDDAEPGISFTADESERRLQLQGALYTFADEETVKFINGRRPLSEWNDYVAQLERLGYEELEDIFNAALARTK